MSATTPRSKDRVLLGVASVLFAAGIGTWLVLAMAWEGRLRVMEARQAELLVEFRAAATPGSNPSADSEGEAPEPLGRVVRGSSAEGDLQEALDAALRAAEASQPGADMRLEWTLESIRGVRGGIRGEREVAVEIRVR